MKGIATLTAFCLSLLLAPPAQARSGYFGQNKVQCRSFKFQVLKTDHFDIYYYPEEEAAARIASRLALGVQSETGILIWKFGNLEMWKSWRSGLPGS